MQCFRDEVPLYLARNKMKPIRWTLQKFQIDGTGLERWCLKTLINVHSEGQYRIGTDSDTVGKPSLRLVRVAFGKEKFAPRAGLYGLGTPGQNFDITDGFRLMPFANKDNVLTGGLFGIHGYQFLLCVEETGLQDYVSVVDFLSGEKRSVQTLYPLKRINFTIGRFVLHAFLFNYT